MKEQQSRAGWIREHLNELEQRLGLGVRRSVIVADLQALGYRCTVQELSNDLARARRRRRERESTALNTSRSEGGHGSSSEAPVKANLLQKLSAPTGMRFAGSPSKSDEEDLF
jgi:hypothetical protein